MATLSNISITVGGAAYVYPSPTDGDWEGITHYYTQAMDGLPLGEGQEADTPAADRPGYLADPVAWLQSVIIEWSTGRNGSTDPDEITACMSRAIKSWSTDPAPVPTVDPGTEPAPTANAVPTYIANAQARLWLKANGLFDGVDVAVRSVADPALTKWEYANIFYRSDPLIEAIATALGKTSDDMDRLFVEASTL
jgi:hypothetical protein